METDDSVDDVVAAYESQLEDNGWSIDSRTSSGGATVLFASNGDQAATVTIGEEGGTTTIGIIYGTFVELGGGDGGSDGGSSDGGDGGDGSDTGSDDGGDDGNGGDADLPDEVDLDEAFPDNIAFPDDARITSSSSVSSGGVETIIVTALSEQSVDDLEAHFKDELQGAGYTEVIATSADGDVFLSYAPDGDSSGAGVVVTIVDSTSYDGYTEIAISVTQSQG